MEHELDASNESAEATAGLPTPPTGVDAAPAQEVPEERSSGGRVKKVVSVVRAATAFFLKLCANLLIAFLLEFTGRFIYLGLAYLLICLAVFLGHRKGILPHKTFRKLIAWIRGNLLSGVREAFSARKNDPLRSSAHLLAVTATAISIFGLISCLLIGLVYLFIPALNGAADRLSFDLSPLSSYYSGMVFLIPQLLLVASVVCGIVAARQDTAVTQTEEEAGNEHPDHGTSADPSIRRNVKLFLAREAILAVVVPLALLLVNNVTPVEYIIMRAVDAVMNIIGFLLLFGFLYLLFKIGIFFSAPKTVTVSNRNQLVNDNGNIYKVESSGNMTFLGTASDVSKGRLELLETKRYATIFGERRKLFGIGLYDIRKRH